MTTATKNKNRTKSNDFKWTHSQNARNDKLRKEIEESNHSIGSDCFFFALVIFTSSPCAKLQEPMQLESVGQGQLLNITPFLHLQPSTTKTLGSAT